LISTSFNEFYWSHYAGRRRIGSLNGRGRAYFLLQHKPQLGGATFVWKIRIFRRDDDKFDAPILLIYVDKREN
jgi:hypothetical protein